MKSHQALLVAAAAAFAALALAGCSGSQSSDTQAHESAKPAPKAITGTVSLRNPETAPAITTSAQLHLALVDISQRPNATIASKTVAPVTSLPLSFSLPFDHARVLPGDLYLLKASITDGERSYTAPLQQLVLTQHHSAKIDVKLVAQKTPAEGMLDAFQKAKAQLGRMTVHAQTSLGKTESLGWQTFRDNGKLKFIVANTDRLTGAKDHLQTTYAYKDGRPWVIVRKHLASAGAKPSRIDRAGWDSHGKLVLHEYQSGGDIKRLSDADAQRLRSDAMEMFQRSGGDKKPPKSAYHR